MTQTGDRGRHARVHVPRAGPRRQPLDARSDLFSLGSVLYAMCSGQSPFRADTTVATLRRVSDDQPRPLREITPALPAGLVLVIDKLLAKTPDKRLQTAAEVAQLLAGQLAAMQGSYPRPLSREGREEKKIGIAPLLGIAGLVLAIGAGVGLARVNGWWPAVVEPMATNNAPQPLAPAAIAPSRARSQPPQPVVAGPPPAIAPFTSDEARQHQQTWAKHLGVKVEVKNGLGMTFRLIPPGQFRMGFRDDAVEAPPEDQPQHEVVISEPFYLGATEVIVEHFRKFADEAKYKTVAETNGQGSFFNHLPHPELTWRDVTAFHKVEPSGAQPVTCVALPDIEAFCAWLNRRDPGGDLPTSHRCPVGICLSGRFGNGVLVWRRVRRHQGRSGGGDVWRLRPLSAKPVGPVRHARQRVGMVPRRSSCLYQRARGRSRWFAGGRGAARRTRGAVSARWTRLRSAMRLVDSPDRPSPVVGFRLVRSVVAP